MIVALGLVGGQQPRKFKQMVVMHEEVVSQCSNIGGIVLKSSEYAHYEKDAWASKCFAPQ